MSISILFFFIELFMTFMLFLLKEISTVSLAFTVRKKGKHFYESSLQAHRRKQREKADSKKEESSETKSSGNETATPLEDTEPESGEKKGNDPYFEQLKITLEKNPEVFVEESVTISSITEDSSVGTKLMLEEVAEQLMPMDSNDSSIRKANSLVEALSTTTEESTSPSSSIGSTLDEEKPLTKAYEEFGKMFSQNPDSEKVPSGEDSSGNNSHNDLLLIICVLIVVAGISVIGYYFYKKKQEEKNKENEGGDNEKLSENCDQETLFEYGEELFTIVKELLYNPLNLFKFLYNLILVVITSIF